MEFRTQLFELPFQIEFKTRVEWKRAWKYVDNCWRLTSTNGNEIQYDCKLNHVSFSSSKGYRNTTLLKNTANCPARMLVLKKLGLGSHILIQSICWISSKLTVSFVTTLKTKLNEDTTIHQLPKRFANISMLLRLVPNMSHWQKLDDMQVFLPQVSRQVLLQQS